MKQSSLKNNDELENRSQWDSSVKFEKTSNHNVKFAKKLAEDILKNYKVTKII